jgi:hypothetical protein
MMNTEFSRSAWRIGSVFASLLILLNGLGCSGETKVVPVQGQMMYKGAEPAEGAIVVFHAVGSTPGLLGNPPMATVKKDGSFRPTTYKPEDGLPEGEYKITVIWFGQSSKSLRREGSTATDRLKGKYGDLEKTELRATVTKGQTDPIRIDVD